MHQFSGSHAHVFAPDTEQTGDDFVGHHDGVTVQSVQREQQHVAKLLVQCVVPMADRDLGHLCDQGSGEQPENALHLMALAETLQDHRQGNPNELSSGVHHCPVVA